MTEKEEGHFTKFTLPRMTKKISSPKLGNAISNRKNMNFNTLMNIDVLKREREREV